MAASFDGAVALITGSTSGIGKATAASLGRRGAHVLIVGRDLPRGQAVEAALRGIGAAADFLPADLNTTGSARSLARRAIEVGGGHVDILVNNSGRSCRGLD